MIARIWQPKGKTGLAHALVIFGMLSMSPLLPAQVLPDPAVLDTQILVGKAGTTESISRLDYLLGTKLTNLPGFELLRMYLRPNPSAPNAPKETILETFGHLLFIREWSEKARTAGFDIPEASQKSWAAGRTERIDTYLNRESENRVTTVPAELRKELEPRIPEPKASPEARNTSYIFKLLKSGTPDAEKAALRQQMEDARNRILGGQAFQVVAKQVSDAPSAPTGGYVGPITRESGMNPRFIELVFNTPAREISPVTELQNGFYIVLVTMVEPARTLEEDRIRAENDLLEAAREYWRATFRSESLQQFPQAPSSAEAVLLQLRAKGFKNWGLEKDLMVWDQHALAITYFDHLRRATGADEPTSEAIRREYDENPIPYARFGFWKLTRFLVPVGSAESKVGSREEAEKRVADVRQRLLEGLADAELLRLFGGRFGLVIDKTDDWTRTSDQGLADQELVKAPVGGVSRVVSHESGAMFFRKDDQRPIERKPFEEVVEEIRGGKRAGNRDGAFTHVRRQAAEARAHLIQWEEIRRWAEELGGGQ